jgi:PiT family inorganic phosphate transporter
MAPAGSGTSGVDWSQAMGVLHALLFSPVVGFIGSALMLLAMRVLIRNRTLYEAPKSNAPPPGWIRGLLVLTCTSVSFAHGSNDGQKGMGLIMLILIGSVPTAFALNHAMPSSATPAFLSTTAQTQTVFDAYAGGTTVPLATARARVTDAVRTRTVQGPETWAALSALAGDIGAQVKARGEMSAIPAAAVQNVRNDMYLVSEAIRLTQKSDAALSAHDAATLGAYRSAIDAATKFIPVWVKVAVAFALGLGTMVGWKRIVVTVGEKIGKSHLTYAQGASAEMIAALTIGAADMWGLPVSTTHVLSSGMAGTMAANGSGLQ